MLKEQFSITGMTCSACAAHIEKSLKKLKGVSFVNVNLLRNIMIVNYDPFLISQADIIKDTQSGGYNAFPLIKSSPVRNSELQTISQNNETAMLKRILIWSVVFVIPLVYIAMGHMFNWSLPPFLKGDENVIILALSQFLLILPIAYINRRFYLNGFKALLKGLPNMDSLVAIGSAAAIIYSIFAILVIGYGLEHGDIGKVQKYSHNLYFESAGVILTVITIGKYLESKAKCSTAEAISKMLDLAPKKALLWQNGQEVEILTEQVQIGDTVIVKTGAAIPVDGIILEGSAAIDESVITGESLPVLKRVGDKIMTSAVNKNGYIRFKATSVGDDTSLAQIIRLMEEASSSKAPISRLADKVSSIFIPAVMAVAVTAVVVWLLLGYGLEFALGIGIAVMVISCPCALGLAAPVAIMVATGKGASNGILIKSAESLEIMQQIDTVVLDKTGTVTSGKPQVTDIIASAGYQEQDVLLYAASVEQFSDHPLALAITSWATESNLSLLSASQLDIKGQGLKAQIALKQILVGNQKFIQAAGIDTDVLSQEFQIFAKQGKTVLFVACDKELCGLIAVADVAKDTSKQAVADMQAMGLEVILLTGDNKQTAGFIAGQLGIETVYSEVLPQDKEAVVYNLQKHGCKVAMVGDGINDAPALSRADVGLAIGAGTDIAIEAADMVLVKSDLQDVVTAIHLSHDTIRNIKQNLFLAFFYNIIGIPLAAGVFYGILGWLLNPMYAAVAMSLSSLFVVLNALRLRTFKASSVKITVKKEKIP